MTNMVYVRQYETRDSSSITAVGVPVVYATLDLARDAQLDNYDAPKWTGQRDEHGQQVWYANADPWGYGTRWTITETPLIGGYEGRD